MRNTNPKGIISHHWWSLCFRSELTILPLQCKLIFRVSATNSITSIYWGLMSCVLYSYEVSAVVHVLSEGALNTRTGSHHSPQSWTHKQALHWLLPWWYCREEMGWGEEKASVRAGCVSCCQSCCTALNGGCPGESSRPGQPVGRVWRLGLWTLPGAVGEIDSWSHVALATLHLFSLCQYRSHFEFNLCANGLSDI